MYSVDFNEVFHLKMSFNLSRCRDLCFGGMGGGGFIGDVQSLVYVCGKSLNLLRLCAPQHHLCRYKSDLVLKAR